MWDLKDEVPKKKLKNPKKSVRDFLSNFRLNSKLSVCGMRLQESQHKTASGRPRS